jgi:hypothetical protein
MTDRNDTDAKGGDGGNDIRSTCPDGAYLTKIYGAAGRYVDRVCGVCSDGTELKCMGSGNGGGPYEYEGSFKKLRVNAGVFVDKIFDSGTSGGDVHELTCPEGKVMVGYFGRAGAWVNKIGAVCGIDASSYCVNNLETDLCRKQNATILNKACEKNMSATCVDRRNELNESLIQRFCANKPNDPLCACYAPPPEYAIQYAGVAPCWNKKCADGGYIPMNMRNPCPPITICQQKLGTEGNSNMLTNNVIVQDCPSYITVKPTDKSVVPYTTTTGKAGDTTTNSGTTGDTTTGGGNAARIAANIKNDVTITPNEEKSSKTSTLVYVFIAFIVLFIAVAASVIIYKRRQHNKWNGQPMGPPMGQQMRPPMGQRMGPPMGQQMRPPMGPPMGQQMGRR